TGRLAGKAQGLRQTCPIVTPPLRHGRITPVPTQQGTTHQGQDRGQRVTLPLMTAEIRYLGQDLDERTRLCLPLLEILYKSVLARVRAVPGLPHGGQNALSLRCCALSTTLPKTKRSGERRGGK